MPIGTNFPRHQKMALVHASGRKITKREILAIAITIAKEYKGRCDKGMVFHIFECCDSNKDLKINEKYTAAYPLVVIKRQLYSLEKSLGKGAFGQVYAGHNLMTGEKVAVKCQRYQCCPDPMVQKQVCVTKCHGIGLCNPDITSDPAYLSDGNVYFVLPLADTVYFKWAAKMIREHPVNGWKKLIAAYIKIADDLERMHSAPEGQKVHMDLKADNVLIVDDVAYLADFGKTERVGKMLPLIPAMHSQYPHNAPEYFVGYGGAGVPLGIPGVPLGIGEPKRDARVRFDQLALAKPAWAPPAHLVNPAVCGLGFGAQCGFGSHGLPHGVFDGALIGASSMYTVKASFDAWSLGFMINGEISKFPLKIQGPLKALCRSMMNLIPELRPSMSEVKKQLENILKYE